MISRDDILDARRRVAPVLRPTPAILSEPLTHLAGRPVVVKPENRQRTGSFKVRGAYNLVSRLAPGTEVVAASAGNHAQGVALAAALSGLKATIFMPQGAALPKVEATAGYGARIHLEGMTVDETLAAGRAFAVETRAHFVPPFDDPLIVAGQGTIGLELAEESPSVDAVVVPVGGGGLISGIAVALSDSKPRPRIIGVQAAGADSMRRSLDNGRPTQLAHMATMADGIAVGAPSPLTLEHVSALVDDVVTVEEDAISQALLLLLERDKALVEPAGAVGLAALLSGKVAGDGPVALVLSGGNIDPLVLLNVVHHGLSATGRYLLLRIVLDDRPGELARLAEKMAEMGLNILSVEHHRAGLGLPVDQVEVVLTVETRGLEHRREVVGALRSAGYRAKPVS